ncbi:MAG: GNAT family N-acetyltransferase, partial [Pseudomonadota bacterium]
MPPFVARELERLYGSFFSTMTHFNASGRLEKISTYVAAKGGEISALFLFSMMRKKISVLNEVITVKPHDLLQFSNYIFSTYDAIQLISFHAIQIDRVQLKRPVQRINCLEDIVLRLPDSNDEYFMRLGKSTRKTIKGYTNKLKRDFPSFNNQVYHNEAADELDIRTIIELSRARLLMNGKVSTFDEAAIVRILHSVKVYGLVCVAKINGEICAGSISYRVGKNYFMHVSAHDLFYDDYR